MSHVRLPLAPEGGRRSGERGDRVNVDVRHGTIAITTTTSRGANTSSETNEFSFERVCGEKEDNASLLQTVGKPIVESVCIGYNGTLFAYGQTGSGKTYTIGEMKMLGTPHEGVAHRMVRHLYQEAASLQPGGAACIC